MIIRCAAAPACGRPAQGSSASERPKGGAADHGEPPHGMHPHRVSASLSEKEGSVVTAANHCFGHQRESTRGILIGGEAVLRSARAGAGAGGLWGRAGVHAQKPFAKALRISPSERATPPSLLNLKLLPRACMMVKPCGRPMWGTGGARCDRRESVGRGSSCWGDGS